MKIFIVFLFYVLLLYEVVGQEFSIPFPTPTCPFGTNDETSVEFNYQPRVENFTSDICSGLNKSCCKESYLDRIENGTDLITPVFMNFFSEMSNSCRLELQKFACVPCYADSSYWVQKLATSTYKFTLCSNYCSTLFSNCATSIIHSNSQTVNESYSNSEVFCSALFQGSNFLVNVVPSTEKGCLDRYNKLCTEKDVGYYYTDCHFTRDLLYSWNSNSTCNGGIGLPPNTYGISCPIECNAGSYLELGTTHCLPCEPGRYSLGGGYRIHNWNEWNTRSFQFTTYRTDQSWNRINGAPGWSLNISFVTTTNQGLHNTKDVLETEVNILNDGRVSFRAQVDSEYNYDRFNFYVDNNVTWIKTSSEPEKFTFPLTTGYHRLRWVYNKDFSVNFGYDRAIIYMIEVLGMSDASDYCDLCPPGTTSDYGSIECTNCPLNTFNNASGSSMCTDCPAHQYAFEGDTFCKEKLDCTQEDYSYTFTQCSANLDRMKIYDWKVPKICRNDTATSEQLPPTTITNCAPCNPGLYRAGEDCLVCPIGSYSPGGDATTCTKCSAGTYAPKQLSLHNWDEWPENTTTRCDGTLCGSPGWRLGSTYADSGSDHGMMVDVFLSIPLVIEAEPYGIVYYDFALFCQNWCYLELRDGNNFLYSSWSTTVGWGNRVTTPEYLLVPGPHTLNWKFTKLYGERTAIDRAELYKITIDGVTNGGAGECVPCSPGTASEQESESCQICQAGYYAPGLTSSCYPCEPNTYSNLPAQGSCKPCGPGTETVPGSTECNTNNCTYSPPGSTDVYDLKPLSLISGMYGPVEDSSWPPIYYYVNPCQRQAKTNNSICRGDEGQPLDVFACQNSLTWDYSITLGRVMGYYPLNSNEKGFILSFIEGDPGCGNANLDQPDVPRSLNITFICDPSAGEGVPDKNGTIYVGTQYPDVCKYHLYWRSIYACPICTVNDYINVTEACNPNGKQVTRFLWKQSCTGGVPLPEPIETNCDSTLECRAGFYAGSSGCTRCPIGTYSLGTGHKIVPISSINRYPFNTSCVLTVFDHCETWSNSDDGQWTSGTNGLSILETSAEFITEYDDFVLFEYQYAAWGNPFTFKIDSETVFSASQTHYENQYDYISLKFPISIGYHVFTWTYSHGERNFTEQRDNFVRIRNIQFRGLTKALTSCTPCPPGHQSLEDRTDCEPCDINTHLVDGRCQRCPPGQYRLLNQIECLPQPACTEDDYIQMYTGADNFRCPQNVGSGFRTSIEPKAPQICNGTGTPQTISSCVPCPTGTKFIGQVCKSCPAGEYILNGQCVKAQDGTAVNKTLLIFTPGDIYSKRPSGFISSCYGICTKSDEVPEKGWRIFPFFADSGLQVGGSFSVLEYEFSTDNYTLDPTISFTLTLKNPLKQVVHYPLSSGIEVYLDGVLQIIPFTLRMNIPLTYTLYPSKKYTSHKIVWVFSLSTADPLLMATLTDLKVFPSPIGAGFLPITCPPGSYTSDNIHCKDCIPSTYSLGGSKDCTKCPAGFVSPARASACTPCKKGTSNYNNVCKSTCTFNIPDSQDQIDLRPLKGNIYTFSQTPSGSTYEINLCDPFYSEHCYGKCIDSAYIYMIPKDTIYGTSVGGTLEFLGIPPPTDTYYNYEPYHSFTLEYRTKGADAPYGCSDAITRIQFFCSAIDEGFGSMAIIQDAYCVITFNWNTTYACPKCTEADLIEEYSSCVDNQRRVSYRFKRPCHDVDVIKPPIARQESCENVTVNRSYGFLTVAGVIGILLVGFGLAILFFRQKRDLENKYHQLKTDHNLGDSDGDDNVLAQVNTETSDVEVELDEDLDEDDKEPPVEIPLED